LFELQVKGHTLEEESKAEVRRILQTAFGSLTLHGELSPREHFAKLSVVGHPEIWLLIYGGYMDFAYTGKISPDTLIDEVFAPLQSAQIIDWSPGRLACVEYKTADADELSLAIDGLIKKLYGLTDYKLEGSLETFGRA